MLEKIFSKDGIKNFFKVRDDEGNLDWQQVLATLIQLIMILGTLYFLWRIEII